MCVRDKLSASKCIKDHEDRLSSGRTRTDALIPSRHTGNPEGSKYVRNRRLATFALREAIPGLGTISGGTVDTCLTANCVLINNNSWTSSDQLLGDEILLFDVSSALEQFSKWVGERCLK